MLFFRLFSSIDRASSAAPTIAAVIVARNHCDQQEGQCDKLITSLRKL